ncbi:MAG: hypothetical protein K0R69_1206 [Clostridia bacterium]|jgi:flagellar motility protein MotE (MotC chaperone)|nr:hypothetical protein [Clostridia bacterium]
MADKNKKPSKLDAVNSPLTPKRRKKGKGIFIVLGILTAVGIAGFIFKDQISAFLGNALKDVPIVNEFFKQDADPYKNLTKQQVITELQNKTLAEENLNQTISELEEQNRALTEKISALEQYESNYAEFISQKQVWDENIAKTNPQMFLEQFEKMYPDTMEAIYRDLKIDDILTKKQKDFSNTVAQMEEEQAAKALETLIATDPELIKQIFEGMQQDRKSLILSNMQSQNAAVVIKLLSPEITQNDE